MFTVLSIILAVLTILAGIQTFKKIQLHHLTIVSNSIILLYPFEYLPSIQVSGARLKINYIAISVGMYLFINLLIRKKINFPTQNKNYLLGFLLLSTLGSISNVIDNRRFVVSYLGLILCVLAAFLVANYACNIKLQLKRLFYILVGCSAFGAYQFIGDMIGVKPKFTFLRELYTKAVFGIPRIQGTANEPQLFAGMLFVVLAVVFVYFVTKGPDNNPLGIRQNHLVWTGIFVTLVFLLTISKGAFLALGLSIIILTTYWAVTNQKIINSRHILLALPALIIIASFVIGNSYLSTKLAPIFENVVTTVEGTSPTSVERSSFVDLATKTLEVNPFFGIGPGQYGPYSSTATQDNSTLIVNNVYLEVWLEYGLLTLVLFLTLLGLALYRSLSNKTGLNLIISITLISFLIQWLFFSPIFITPIFIIIGMCLNRELANEFVN
jgi:O-antigen ligase